MVNTTMSLLLIRQTKAASSQAMSSSLMAGSQQFDPARNA